jgi:hypothetical protein
MHHKTIRDGEAEATEARSHRFYEKNSQWFVQTREGYELGPFTDSGKAEQALKDYISFLETADSQSIANLFNEFKEKLQTNQD